jgi:hypothetical protein
MTNITSGFKATGLYLLKATRKTAFASFMLTEAPAPFIPDAVDKKICNLLTPPGQRLL